MNNDTNEIEEREARLESERARLDAVRERKDEVTSAIARLRADGSAESDEAESLRAERRELLAEEDELSASIPILTEMIESGRREIEQARARGELTSAKRRAGGVVGQMDPDVKVAAELLDQLEPVVDRLLRAHSRASWERALADAVADRFKLERPSIRVPYPPGADDRVTDLRSRIARLGSDEGPSLSAKSRRGTPDERIREAAGVLDRYWDVGTTAVDLLDTAGPGREEREKAEKAAQEQAERESEARAALAPVAGPLAVAQGEPDRRGLRGGG